MARGEQEEEKVKERQRQRRHWGGLWTVRPCTGWRTPRACSVPGAAAAAAAAVVSVPGTAAAAAVVLGAQTLVPAAAWGGNVPLGAGPGLPVLPGMVVMAAAAGCVVWGALPGCLAGGEAMRGQEARGEKAIVLEER